MTLTRCLSRVIILKHSKYFFMMIFVPEKTKSS